MVPLATSDPFADDVLILPVVVAELELSDVERQVLGADFVERADHASLEDRPEAFNRVGVDRSDHVLALGVVDNLVRKLRVETAIAYPLIRDQQAHLLRNRAAHETLEGHGIYASNNPCYDVALA